MLLILKPCVGMVWVMSSDVKVFRMVVLPALSKPRTRIRASASSCKEHQKHHMQGHSAYHSDMMRHTWEDDILLSAHLPLTVNSGALNHEQGWQGRLGNVWHGSPSSSSSTSQWAPSWLGDTSSGFNSRWARRQKRTFHTPAREFFIDIV